MTEDLQIIYKRPNLTWTWSLSITKSFEGQLPCLFRWEICVRIKETSVPRVKGYLFSSEMTPNVINDYKTSLSLEHVEHLVFLSKIISF